MPRNLCTRPSTQHTVSTPLKTVKYRAIDLQFAVIYPRNMPYPQLATPHLTVSNWSLQVNQHLRPLEWFCIPVIETIQWTSFCFFQFLPALTTRVQGSFITNDSEHIRQPCDAARICESKRNPIPIGNSHQKQKITWNWSKHDERTWTKPPSSREKTAPYRTETYRLEKQRCSKVNEVEAIMMKPHGFNPITVGTKRPRKSYSSLRSISATMMHQDIHNPTTVDAGQSHKRHGKTPLGIKIGNSKNSWVPHRKSWDLV